MSSPQDHESSVTAGMPRGLDRHPLRMPSFPGLRRTGDRFGYRRGSQPLRQSGIPSQRIEEASTVGIPGVGGCAYGVRSSPAETALAHKFKHPKGLRCHHTFRIGAPPRNWSAPCPGSSARCKTIRSRSDPIYFLFADQYVPLLMRGCISPCSQGFGNSRPEDSRRWEA